MNLGISIFIFSLLVCLIVGVFMFRTWVDWRKIENESWPDRWNRINWTNYHDTGYRLVDEE